VGAAKIGPGRAGSPGEGIVAGEGTLTVASMNLHCGFSAMQEPFDVAAVVRSLDATVIAVQEAWTAESAAADPSGDPLAAAARDLGATVVRAPMCGFADLRSLGLPGGSGPGQLGIAVLSKLPVAGHEVISLGVAPGDPIPRVAQVVWLEVGELLNVGEHAVLRFVNTHLTYRPFSPIQLWRLRQKLREHSGPTILVGDLNMPRPIASLTSGLVPAVTGRTWPADRPLVQLDNVLAGGAVEPVAGSVLPHVGSDHLPVRAELRLRAARYRARKADRAAADR
jgi:endonuclease/exonuclease/phosphatase family metal-dependent hydrolase